MPRKSQLFYWFVFVSLGIVIPVYSQEGVLEAPTLALPGATPEFSDAVLPKLDVSATATVLDADSTYDEALSQVDASVRRLASTLLLITQAYENLKANNGLGLSETCQLRLFLSRSQAIAQHVGARANWMPDPSELQESVTQTRSALFYFRQLPQTPLQQTALHWEEMESAENLVEMGMAISPVPISQLKPEPVMHCPVMVQMIPGENYGVWFHEKIDVIQSQKKGFLNLQTTRVRKIKEVKVYVDVDGTHSLHQPKEQVMRY